MELLENHPLAPLTSLGLGGPAEWFVKAKTDDDIRGALQWAGDRGCDATILGEGSNAVIADRGIRGIVVQIGTRGLSFREDGDDLWVEAVAGESWDDLVAETVRRNAAGMECLSGIPGSVGATPIQNVGAYGQEVADAIAGVIAFDRESHDVVELAPEQCSFSYRNSRFKMEPRRFVVLRVLFRLRMGAPPSLRYGELLRAFDGRPSPKIADVRRAVLSLRRSKSMLLDPSDPNGQSAGSFFTNPVLSEAGALAAIERGRRRGLVSAEENAPTFPAGPGRTKMAAGWLIERAGFSKGLRRGPVGISTKHALALVHHGGGTTRALMDLAQEIQRGVQDAFGVELQPEPVLLGFETENPG
ncbi:MAG: UDP-N-acetylmuramate dehydrogenase [Myxococcales bacterium]|nr:UDP-N-acetylmuramate dehydrogenase [Myxococcales bacterium]